MRIIDASAMKAAIRRDGKCMNCGNLWGLQAHHIIPVGAGQDGDDVLEDLITFCWKCHVPLFHDQSWKYKVKESWLDQSQIDYVLSKRWVGWKGIEWDITGGAA